MYRQSERGFADVSGVSALMDDLEAVLSSCDRNGNVNVYIDLTEAHGYRYHSGVVFALYARELGAPIAKGGRYDGVGEAFGRSRPATGFAIDLKAWSMLQRCQRLQVRLYRHQLWIVGASDCRVGAESGRYGRDQGAR